MLKIPKGLKKKKKGKKGKHKGDEDLFTPEELEAYRREKALKEQQQLEVEQAQEVQDHEEGEGSPPEHKNEENLAHAVEDEDRFQALLGGVDSILNKTQKDLDRIKSTSYFQRKPTPSELGGKKPPVRPERPTAAAVSANASSSTKSKKKKRWVGFEEGQDEFETDEEEEKFDEKVEEKTGAPPAEELHTAHSEESEEDEEDDADDIFDTSYIDVITSGEVKLAYIPESPTEEQQDGEDPFDTTYAAKVIGNDEDIKKRQKLEKVSLGIAVDVLTGKAAPPPRPPALPENAAPKRAVPRRVKPVSLLKLESLEDSSAENFDSALPNKTFEETENAPKSLLDDDALLAIPDDLPPVGTPIIPPASIAPQSADKTEHDTSANDTEVKEKEKHLDLSEFDVIAEKPVVQLPVSNLVLVAAALGAKPEPALEEDDELEDEFAALAAESLQKKKEDEFEVEGDDPFDTSVAAVVLGEPAPQEPKPVADVDVILTGKSANWSAFDDDDDHHHKVELKPSRPPPPRPIPPKSAAVSNLHEEADDVDPFDTSFAQNILPGKTELKFIEKEILGKSTVEVNEARILSNSDSDFDFNPREGEDSKGFQSGVSIHVTDPAGQKESPEGDPFDTEDTGLTALRPIHRDLLGGSTTDLSKLAHDPIEPAPEPLKTSSPLPDEIEDPFDTSRVEAVAAPGKTELKYLEKEILGDVKAVPLKRGLSDESFDPRAEEEYRKSEGKISRPDVLIVQSTAEQSAPSHKTVAFALPSPALRADLLGAEGEEGTKFSKPLTPYYAEVKTVLNGDSEADPFDTAHVSNLGPGKTELKIIENELVGDSASKISCSLYDEEFDPRAKSPGTESGVVNTKESADIFAVGEDIGHKPLTPSKEDTQDIDPFDTSIASNIAPGKAELKVLEKELISEDPQATLKRTYTDPDFNPRDGPVQPPDLLNEPETEGSGAKPLTPILGEQGSFENGEEDVDPFDTSFAAQIRPGKAELRVLESELIGKE